MSAHRARLADGRWHFQHGPIDLVIAIDGAPDACAEGLAVAWRRFPSILPELVEELALLRAPVGAAAPPRGPVAARMHAACAPYAPAFVTPMAAVAGAVAEEVLDCLVRPGVARASVNNGGDVALHLARDMSMTVGIAQIGAPLGARDGIIRLEAAMPWRGVATSGWRGRSQSLGVADSVTAVARTAAAADAAATMIANAVDVEDPRIERLPACEIRDGSDLGERLVTVSVPPLAREQIEHALAAGSREAARCEAAGLIAGAALSLQGIWRVSGTLLTQGAGLREAA